MEHRRDLLMAQGLAILAALMAVPVPLLLPLLVDEVLLQHPGFAVRWMDSLFPAEWHGPLSYILALLGLTLLLRILAALFNVLQTRAFSLISKDIIYRIREPWQRLGDHPHGDRSRYRRSVHRGDGIEDVGGAFDLDRDRDRPLMDELAAGALYSLA